MGPPSSGGICLAQLMQMVEPYNLKAMGHNSPGAMHVMVEAERRSYADRAHFLGDPDFVTIPQDHLLDKTYANERMQNFSTDKTLCCKFHGDNDLGRT